MGGQRIHKQDELLNEIASAGYVVIAGMSMLDSELACNGSDKFRDIQKSGTFLLDASFYSDKVLLSYGWGLVGYKQGAAIGLLGLSLY